MNEKLEDAFKHHPPSPGAAVQHANIREATKALAYLYDKTIPDSREKSLALTKLEEAAMWANAGLARN